MRRDYLIRANAELNNLISQIEVASELFGLEPDKMKFWMEIVEKEIRLVKGTIKNDRERYKDLSQLFFGQCAVYSWWLRTALSQSSFREVYQGGSLGSYWSDYWYGVALGFCQADKVTYTAKSDLAERKSA